MEILSTSIGALIGAILGFLAAALYFKSRSAAKADFDQANKNLAQANLDLGVSRQREQGLVNNVEALGQEKISLSNQLREVTESCNQIQIELSVCREKEAGLLDAKGSLTRERDQYLEQLNGANQELVKLSTEFANCKALLDTQATEIEKIREQSKIEFKNIANEILQNHSESFTKSNQENISKILEPLGTEITEFKKKVEETYDKESKERFSLDKSVKALIEQTDKISEDATNLTNALKGQSKKQGDWGELILVRVLESCGLEKGREFAIQQTIKDDDGKNLRPDVLIHLPENRTVIADSKVSLTAYERYNSCESDDESKTYLQEHINSIYSHIDGLSGKKYEELESAPDFVLMFVPIEPAYLLAIHSDGDLWNYAYKKRVMLISPTNLMPVVKLISDLWTREKQSKHHQDIVKRGGILYDKFVTFLETLEDVGVHIRRTQDSFEKASNQLQSGNGNLVWQAQQLKNLGVGKKALPATMMDSDSAGEFDLTLDSQVLTSSNLID
jgi:DNA recombination protein RmuC